MMRAVDVASVAAGAYVSIRGPSPALNNGAAHAHTGRRQNEPKIHPPVTKFTPNVVLKPCTSMLASRA